MAGDSVAWRFYAIIAPMSTVTTPTGRRERRSVDSAASGELTPHTTSRAAYLLVLLLLSLFAWAPLLYPGYLQAHSGFLPVFNLASLAAAPDKLRWLPTIGVTPDLLHGEGPLAYWLALLPRSLAGDVGAVKAVFAFSILAGGLGVYAWTRRSLAGWSNEHDLLERAALLAAVVFVLWPPLLMTVYVRGALAEALLMALLPWALWGVARVRGSEDRRSKVGGRGLEGRGLAVAGAALLAAALAWTQAGLALWATGLVTAWALWPGAERRRRLQAALATLIGAALGLGSFWLLHRGLASAAQPLEVAAHAVYPYQLFIADWSFSVSTAGWKGELPLQLGLAAASLAILTVLLGLAKPHAAPDETSATAHRSPLTGHRSPLAFAALAALILILLTTTLAQPLWRNLPALAATVTYPWQLFALVGPLLALLAGALLTVERRLAVLPLWAAAATFVVLSSYPYLAPRFTQVTPDPARPAIFGDNQVTLLAAGLEQEDFAPAAPITATQTMTVAVAWQPLNLLDFDYNIFVHALDADGQRIAQWDGQPQRGAQPYPMTAWRAGEVVPDHYALTLDGGRSLADVRSLWLGLYNWQTGQRLLVNGDDKVVVDVTGRAPGRAQQETTP